MIFRLAIVLLLAGGTAMLYRIDLAEQRRVQAIVAANLVAAYGDLEGARLAIVKDQLPRCPTPTWEEITWDPQLDRCWEM